MKRYFTFVLAWILVVLIPGVLFIFPAPVAAAGGSLTIHTSPSAVSYDLGIKTGKTDSWGDARLSDILAGTYTLKLIKDGSQEWSKQVKIETGKTTEVYAYLESGTGQAPVRAETILPSSTKITLSLNTAAGASMYVDGEYAGTTDSWGSCNASGFLAGTYTLKITKPNCKQWSKKVAFEAGKTTKVYAYLEQGAGEATTREETIMPAEETGTLELVALPGTSVYIDEEYSGTTDSWGDVDVVGLPGGTYTLKLVKPDYKEWTKQVRFEPEQTTTVFAYMEPGTGRTPTREDIVLDNVNYGTLEVDAAIQGVVIYVGREYSGATDSWGDAEVGGLPPGIYTVTLAMEGYKEWSKRVKIGADISTRMRAYLEPGSGTTATRQEIIAPNTPTGTLNLDAPPGASIFVGGEYSGKTNSDGNATVSGVFAGKHTVTVVKSGYKEWSQEVSILAGDQVDVKAGMLQIVAADFSADDTHVKIGQTVQFTNLTSGSAQSWVWDFGDGSTGTLKDPAHVFKRDGSYTVSLTVYEPGGSDTRTIKDYITVYTPPSADFRIEPPVPLAGETVKFINTTEGTATAWQWDFGNGDVSTEKEPEHVYEQGGVYEVTLTARYEDEISTVTKPVSVRFRILFSGASIPALSGLGVMFITALVAALRKTSRR